MRTSTISNDEEQKIEAELAKVGGDVTKVDDQTIGASLGKELRNNALIAFGVAFLAQLLYLAVRFKWTFGVSAVLAMAHDVILVVGLFAWLHKPIDGIFLAAAMTIVGLSVNDTVVVFDKVKENTRGITGQSVQTFQEAANLAVNQTLVRSINTSIVALLPVLAIIIVGAGLLGAGTLLDLAVALAIGMAVGAYSSVFIATPFFVDDTPLDVLIVMQRERSEGAQEMHDETRTTSRARVLHLGDDALAALPIAKHLAKKGAVAMQIDRAPPSGRTIAVELLGRPFAIPPSNAKSPVVVRRSIVAASRNIPPETSACATDWRIEPAIPASLAAKSPIVMSPICASDEYASTPRRSGARKATSEP